MNADNQVSLTDIVKLALPLNTEPLGNANQRAKIVNWGVVLTDWGMIRDQVQLGDLVIVPSRLQEGSSNTQLVAGLKAMSSIAAVGLLLFNPVDSGIAAEAEKLEIPILFGFKSCLRVKVRKQPEGGTLEIRSLFRCDWVWQVKLQKQASKSTKQLKGG